MLILRLLFLLGAVYTQDDPFQSTNDNGEGIQSLSQLVNLQNNYCQLVNTNDRCLAVKQSIESPPWHEITDQVCDNSDTNQYWQWSSVMYTLYTIGTPDINTAWPLTSSDGSDGSDGTEVGSDATMINECNTDETYCTFEPDLTDADGLVKFLLSSRENMAVGLYLQDPETESMYFQLKNCFTLESKLFSSGQS